MLRHFLIKEGKVMKKYQDDKTLLRMFFELLKRDFRGISDFFCLLICNEKCR